MSKRVMLVTSALAGLTLVGGCTMAESQASKGDVNAQFLTEAAQDSTSEIELSKIAVDRAQDPRVKQFAQMMVQDHDQQNQQLMQVASSKGTDAPARVDEVHGKTATHLRQLSGSQFDMAYMSCMVADHAKVLSKFQDKAASAPDPEVRAFAQSQVATLRAHLDHAREINRSLGGGSTLTAGAASSGTGGASAPPSVSH